MTFDLTKLGWKAFQDLATAVAAEILKRPVQTFLGSNDGGRDGAFLGTWTGDDGQPVKSTIQCKFMGKLGANLTLANLKSELPKAVGTAHVLGKGYRPACRGPSSGRLSHAAVFLTPLL